MSNRIHIFGASGSGTSTLGRHLAGTIHGRFLDADSYYWEPTDPPFTRKRDPAERVRLVERDIEGKSTWVLSGSMCSWGDPLLSRLTLAVFLYLDPAIRMSRLEERERARFGQRIVPGGDMHATHLSFMNWAKSYDQAQAPTRSLDLHERWMARLQCPIIRLNSEAGIENLCGSILASGLVELVRSNR